MTLQINFDDSWNNQLLKRISDDGPWANWELYKLAVVPSSKVYEQRFGSWNKAKDKIFNS